MEAVEVTARFQMDGQIVPTQFVWRGQKYKVNQVGRNWQDPVGQHFLVMIALERVVELLFLPLEGYWYLRTPSPGRLKKI